MRILVALSLMMLLNSCAYYFGNRWQNSYRHIPATDHPTFNERPQRPTDAQLGHHPLVLEQAAQPFESFGQKQKTGSPRVMLAKLLARQQLKEVNELLLSLVPWGNSGTSGALNPKGDYDFTTILLSAILHRFDGDTAVLWERTSNHIANVLLIEEGGRPHTRTPRTMAIMKDTENHILMTNISQYLKNQWLLAHGSTDPSHNNRTNGLEAFLTDLLNEFLITGAYEFNAKPYEGYTVSALLVLQSYAASEELRLLATRSLDMLAYEYMMTSDDFRKSSPFRRRMERANGTSLTDNALTGMMKAWHSELTNGNFSDHTIAHNRHQAFSAIVFNYRPPTAIWSLPRKEQTVLVGHGRGSAPEVYGTGNGFMLCSGGFQRGEASQIVARPIVLMLNDGATELDSVVHIRPIGKWQQWNTTGVFGRMAVGKGAVLVPQYWKALHSEGSWAIYRHADVTAVVYSTPEMGLIYLPTSDATEPQSVLRSIASANTDVSSSFRTQEGQTIQFRLNAPKGKWVITEVSGQQPLETRTDRWPRLRTIP